MRRYSGYARLERSGDGERDDRRERRHQANRNPAECKDQGLLDMERLEAARRPVNSRGVTMCPLCLDVLSSKGFFSRVEQAEGREVHDLRGFQLNLFHIKELRFGVTNHRPYNVAWGHHHCNVVVKDAGILETLKWLKEVVDRNVTEGLFPN